MFTKLHEKSSGAVLVLWPVGMRANEQFEHYDEALGVVD